MTIPSCGRRTTGRPSARYMRSCWARGVWALGPTSGRERAGTIHRCASTWVLPPAGGSPGSSTRGTPRPSRKNSAPRPRRRRSGWNDRGECGRGHREAQSAVAISPVARGAAPKQSPVQRRSLRCARDDKLERDCFDAPRLAMTTTAAILMGQGRAMPALTGIDNPVRSLLDDIQTCAEAQPVVVAFSGGLDSTTVAALAKQALGADRVLLVTVNMRIYNYRRGNEIVLEMAEQPGIKQTYLLGQYMQHRV